MEWEHCRPKTDSCPPQPDTNHGPSQMLQGEYFQRKKKSQSWQKELLLWMVVVFERRRRCFAGCRWKLNLTLWSLLIYFWGKGWGKSAVRRWRQPFSRQVSCPLSYLHALLVKTEKLSCQYSLWSEPSALKPADFRGPCSGCGRCTWVTITPWGQRVTCLSCGWRQEVRKRL